jgi:hypothetical protein
MKARAEISGDDGIVTVRLPLAIRKRGGLRLVITPDGVHALVPPRRRVDSAMLKAIARAFRWRKLLETSGPTLTLASRV